MGSMRASIRVVVLLSIATLATVAHSSGQQPAKEINPVPLEHPQPLLSIRSGDAPGLMTRLREAMTASGLAITRTDSGRLLIEGRHPDREGSTDYDRVLVWLERAPLEPAASVDVYLAYGRYEEILARNGRQVFRVVVPQAYEEQRTSALKQRLMALAN